MLYTLNLDRTTEIPMYKIIVLQYTLFMHRPVYNCSTKLFITLNITYIDPFAMSQEKNNNT